MRGVAHSPAFKAKMVQKMLMPDGPSAYALAREANVPQSTLARWKREALTIGGMSKQQTKGAPRRRKRRSASEKLRLVQRAGELTGDELGAFLRQEGIHASQLQQWREVVHEALGDPTPESRRREREIERENKSLKRELQRKEKALAESAALLWLKKKAQDIWGDEDDDTAPRSGE